MRCDKFCGLPPFIVIVESLRIFFVLIVEFEIAGDTADVGTDVLIVGVVVPLAGVELFWAATVAAALVAAVVELGFVVDDTVKC